MTDHNQDRSKDEGQQGIDRETEKRNRENETGQKQEGGQQTGGQSGSGFIGTKGDQSSDYLTKGEESQDFASQGQGAQDTNAGTADIETGQRKQGSDSELDDGSDSSR